ncbi:molybdopterin molybdotransferase MoeA [Clostridium sp.]|uniref:molybdopterin molybdotransferase MoeA n=1 Tax=Clostridium sp. TaxID=1506 RepID=UPI002FC6C367
MISLEEANDLILSKVKNAEFEKININDALNRVLYEDIYSTIDSPPFPRSPLDGYALRGEDVINASEVNVNLKVIDKIFAGYTSDKYVKKGEAIRIMTGAPIPKGCNCIVRQEDTKERNGVVRIIKSHNPYDNYCYEGEDFKEGTKILGKNCVITSSEIMAIASIGKDSIKVYKKPIVGILNTGDEIQNPGEDLLEGKIYNSNGYFLSSRVLELGCIPVVYNIICDDEGEIIKAISKLYDDCDLIISTGGVSVGEKDIVMKCAEKVGFNTLFWKVDIKPGSPMFAGEKCGKVYIGLSGTPVAAATTFELTARKVISFMMNCPPIDVNKRIGILADDFNKVTGKRRFLRVNINNLNEVHINNVYQSPGQVHTMINSNGILEVPKNKALKKGDLVEVLV